MYHSQCTLNNCFGHSVIEICCSALSERPISEYLLFELEEILMLTLFIGFTNQITEITHSNLLRANSVDDWPFWVKSQDFSLLWAWEPCTDLVKHFKFSRLQKINLTIQHVYGDSWHINNNAFRWWPRDERLCYKLWYSGTIAQTYTEWYKCKCQV